ncbi:MAG: response regulator transcription factor [Leadbetterella sp.]
MFISKYIEIDNIKLIETSKITRMTSIKVAIVEDLNDVREGLKYVLEYTDGFECVYAFTDAESALEGLRIQQPDVVIMDIHLPKMSGIDCVKLLKSEFPQLQFLMFSVFEDDENIFEAIKAGASGYILKKTPPSKVLEAIQDLFKGGSPMTASIARRVIAHFQKPKSTDLTSLSPRETEILDLLSKGFFYKEIADKLGTSTGTVRQQIHKIYEKLHVQNRTEAINKVFGKG